MDVGRFFRESFEGSHTSSHSRRLQHNLDGSVMHEWQHKLDTLYKAEKRALHYAKRLKARENLKLWRKAVRKIIISLAIQRSRHRLKTFEKSQGAGQTFHKQHKRKGRQSSKAKEFFTFVNIAKRAGKETRQKVEGQLILSGLTLAEVDNSLRQSVMMSTQVAQRRKSISQLFRTEIDFEVPTFQLTLAQRAVLHEWFHFMAKVSPIFSKVDKQEFLSALDHCHCGIGTFQKEQVIFKQDEQKSHVYLVLDGSVELWKDTAKDNYFMRTARVSTGIRKMETAVLNAVPRSWNYIKTAHTGHFCGEITTSMNIRRSTAIASQASTLLMINARDFQFYVLPLLEKTAFAKSNSTLRALPQIEDDAYYQSRKAEMSDIVSFCDQLCLPKSTQILTNSKKSKAPQLLIVSSGNVQIMHKKLQLGIVGNGGVIDARVVVRHGYQKQNKTFPKEYENLSNLISYETCSDVELLRIDLNFLFDNSNINFWQIFEECEKQVRSWLKLMKRQRLEQRKSEVKPVVLSRIDTGNGMNRSASTVKLTGKLKDFNPMQLHCHDAIQRIMTGQSTAEFEFGKRTSVQKSLLKNTSIINDPRMKRLGLDFKQEGHHLKNLVVLNSKRI